MKTKDGIIHIKQYSILVFVNLFDSNDCLIKITEERGKWTEFRIESNNPLDAVTKAIERYEILKKEAPKLL